MENFYQYIERSLPNKPNDPVLYKYKKRVLDEMSNRANELSSRGLTDKRVIDDLIISEYEGIADDYKEYAQGKALKKKRKALLIGNILGSIVYIFMLIIVFLGIGFSTHYWHPAWVIIVDGVLLWVAYLLSLGINRVLDMKRIFHFIARILLAIAIVVLFVAIFIFLMAVMHVPHAWVLVFVGLFAMFLGDGLFASLTKQKLAIISWLMYIPAMSAMLFVILGGLSIVSWATGWIMIPLSLLLDAIIMYIAYKKNTSYKEEVVDTWQEG